MAKKKIKKKWNYKKTFYLILAASWITGVIFFILNNFITIEGEFGPEKHAWQYPTLKIHGAASFMIMVVFGYFLASHVKKNWYSEEKKTSISIILLSMPFLLIITAYSLYYIPSDEARRIVSYIHFGIGLILPIILITHIKQMKNMVKNRIKKSRKAV